MQNSNRWWARAAKAWLPVLLAAAAGGLGTGIKTRAHAADPSSQPARVWNDTPGGVQLFILAGQSNMVGHGKSEMGHDNQPGAIGSLRYLVKTDPKTFGRLVDGGGNWIVREDVKVWWRDSDITAPRSVIKGNLRIGYSQSRNPEWFGPEYGFGWVVGEHLKGKTPVLIVKVAWGGKSLHVDYRPPSAVAKRGGQVGPYYKALLDYANDAVTNLDTEFPEWRGKGYHIAGIGWHQGWNDRVDTAASDSYEANLTDFITDLRAEFHRPDLAFSITTTGMAPPPEYTKVELAQLAVGDPAKHPEFAGTVRTTDTRPFWRPAEVSPSATGYHWNHNGESEFLNGSAMGRAMVDMLSQQGKSKPVGRQSR